MSLTLSHVLWVVLTTVVGAVAGRAVRTRSRRLRFLKDTVRAWVFGLGLVAVVAYLAAVHASDIAKFGLAGLYIGA
ncbi:MAG: hypothetical protein OWV35_08765, partial [Firmicutes bacterium]|nr:hypothetical protein [Bacillota bacterium]